MPVEQVLEKGKLSRVMQSMVARGAAHWVTIKEGTLAGRHLLISGPRPAKGEQSKGSILAGHGIPPHVLEKLRHKDVQKTEVAGKTSAHDEDTHIHSHVSQLSSFHKYGQAHQAVMKLRVKEAFNRGAHRVVVGAKENGFATMKFGPEHAHLSDADLARQFGRQTGFSRAEFAVIHKHGTEGANGPQNIYNAHGTVKNTETEKKKKEAKDAVKKELASKVMNHLSKYGIADVDFNKESATSQERDAVSAAAVKALDIASNIIPQSAMKKTTVKLVLGKLRRGSSAWAYYTPAMRSITMTSKKNGMQPFYHEYGHAFDHAMAGYSGYASESGMFKPLIDEIRKTESHSSFINGLGKDGTPWAFFDAHGKYGKSYFSSGRETFARFFAEYTYHQCDKKGIAVPPELREPKRFERYSTKEMDHLSGIFEKIMAENGLNKSFRIRDGRLLMKL